MSFPRERVGVAPAGRTELKLNTKGDFGAFSVASAGNFMGSGDFGAFSGASAGNSIGSAEIFVVVIVVVSS